MFVHLIGQFFLEGKMKPPATHHLIPVAAWRHKPKAKNAVLGQIQAITRELEALQGEMQRQFAEPAGMKNRFLEDNTAVEALSRFKAELDQLRRILWFYIEQAAQQAAPAGMDQEQSRRLERVTGLLRALSPQPDVAAMTEQSGSFFERLNLVIDNYMQEKKPAAAESTIAQRPQTKTSS
jgi:hypothetical protein